MTLETLIPLKARTGLAALAFAAVVMPLPAVADPFFFSTGNPDGKIATATRPESAGKFEIESADDFGLTSQTLIKGATFTGLLTGGSAVALIVKFADVPRIPRAERLDVRKLAEGFWEITAHFGFVQVPDLTAALRQAKASGCEIDLKHAIYFNARDAVVAKRTHNLAVRARLLLFAFMLRNAVRAVDLFRIPTENFIEIGRLVEI